MAHKSGLGRGLEALIPGGDDGKTGNGIMLVSVGMVLKEESGRSY